eukprot:3610923-Alexandrium_andersonii.AAC.1
MSMTPLHVMVLSILWISHASMPSDHMVAMVLGIIQASTLQQHDPERIWSVGAWTRRAAPSR